MDFDISTIISTLGFPIAAFCWSAYMIKKEREDSRKDMQEVREAHKLEMSEVTKVLSDNTIVLQGLKQLLEDKFK